MKRFLFAMLLLPLAAEAPAADRLVRVLEPLLMAQNGQSLDDLVSRFRRRNEGRILSADTVDEDGRRVHRLRVLKDDGRVRRFRYDGDTGQRIRRPPPRDAGGQVERRERAYDYDRGERRERSYEYDRGERRVAPRRKEYR